MPTERYGRRPGKPGREGRGRKPQGSDQGRGRKPQASDQGHGREPQTSDRRPARPNLAPRSVVDEVRATARPGQTDRAVKAFEEAVGLLERGRPGGAAARAEEAKDLAPRSGAIREVLGISLYQSERYRDALRELQAYRRITGRSDQNHLIADSHRALGAPEKSVEFAREALRTRAVPDEARAEAAVVGASALADMARYDEAIALVRSFQSREQGTRSFDLRVWYVAGDILERAGRTREAAAEFRKIVRHDAGAFDAAERLAGLNG